MHMQRSTWKWAVPLAAVLLAWALLPSKDDDNTARRAVPVDIELDLGTFAGAALREYRVRSGDTLGQIAQSQLGSVRQLKALQRWNPNIKPTALRVGQALRLPPKGATASGFAFFAWQRDAAGGGRLIGAAQGTRLRGLSHGVILLAAPLDDAEVIEGSLRDAEAFGIALPTLKGVYRSDVLAAAPLVPEHDLTERVLMQIVVEDLDNDHRIQAHAVEVRLDGKGRTIEPVSVETNQWSTLAFTMLGLLALVIAVIVGARRLELAAE